MSFVTNGGWLRSDSANGFRKCLAEEFTAVYVFDLRGNQRTQGEQSRKEGGKIFGSGSRAPVAITFLVKNPESTEHCAIHYHDIGDYLTREDKLSIVNSSVVAEPFEWDMLHPDRHGDWLEQRDDSWYHFAPIGLNNKIGNPLNGLFECYSRGLETGRDSWIYGFDQNAVESRMSSMIDYYNWCVQSNCSDEDKYNSEKIKWTASLEAKADRQEKLDFHQAKTTKVLYRPFCKMFAYWDEQVIHRPGIWRKCFPKGYSNVAFAVCDRGVMITSIVPDLELLHHGQFFPMYWYEKPENVGRMIRHDAITDETLNLFRKVYPGGFGKRAQKDGGIEIQKEDIFYYIYGILHSEEYRSRYSANLKKELPRIPLAGNFKEFYHVGRALAKLHLNYEEAEPYPLIVVGNGENPGRVEKMRWGKKRNPNTGKMEADKSVLVYNNNLTFKGIPDIAHRYVVNGRSPLEWMIDRYQVKTDKASGIVNDPNLYSDDPLYIVNLIRRLVTVSVETMKIIDAMTAINEIDCYIDFPDAWKVHE